MRLLDLTDLELFDDVFRYVHKRPADMPLKELDDDFNPRTGTIVIDGVIKGQGGWTNAYARAIWDYRMTHTIPVFTIITDVDRIDWLKMLSYSSQYLVFMDESIHKLYIQKALKHLAGTAVREIKKRAGVGVDWVEQAIWDAPHTALWKPARQLLGNALRLLPTTVVVEDVFQKYCDLGRAMRAQDPIRGQATRWMLYRHLLEQGWVDSTDPAPVLTPGSEGFKV